MNAPFKLLLGGLPDDRLLYAIKQVDFVKN
jgi:hypothetical protein